MFNSVQNLMLIRYICTLYFFWVLRLISWMSPSVIGVKGMFLFIQHRYKFKYLSIFVLFHLIRRFGLIFVLISKLASGKRKHVPDYARMPHFEDECFAIIIKGYSKRNWGLFKILQDAFLKHQVFLWILWYFILKINYFFTKLIL